MEVLEMSESVISVLGAMEDSIENEKYGQFYELTEELFTAYDESRPDERQFIERAKAISRTKSPDRFRGEASDLDGVSRFLVEAQTTNLNRAGALTGLGCGIPNDVTDHELQTFVTELKEQEESLASARQTAKSEVDAAMVEAAPKILAVAVSNDGPFLAGDTLKLTTSVGNAGDDVAKGAKLAARTPSGVSIDGESERELEIEGGQKQEVVLEIVGEETGTHQIGVDLTYTDTQSTETLEMEVLDGSGFLDRVENRLQTLSDRIEESEVKHGAKRRLLSSVQAALKSNGLARSALSNGRADKMDNHLTTEINQLGALLNKLAAKTEKDKHGKKKFFSDRKLISYRAVTEEIIDLISTLRSSQVA